MISGGIFAFMVKENPLKNIVRLQKAGKSVKQTNLQIIIKIGGWVLLPGNELPGIRA
jgi:hypothetical protein